MTFLDFLRDKIGPNWVVAQRTPYIVARYGADVVCLSQKDYRDLQAGYRVLHGDPHDAQRAALYCALRDLLNAPRDANHALVMRRAQAVLDAEAALYRGAAKPCGCGR